MKESLNSHLTLLCVLILLQSFHNVMQAGIVALDQSAQRIFGHIHTFRGCFCQTALLRE